MPRYRHDDDRPVRRTRRGRRDVVFGLPVWAFVTLAVAAAVLVFGGVWFGYVAFRDVQGENMRANPNYKRHSREEFRALVMGKTEAQVTAAVGKPDKTERHYLTATYLSYQYVTVNPATGKLDWNTTVSLDDGVVTNVSP